MHVKLSWRPALQWSLASGYATLNGRAGDPRYWRVEAGTWSAKSTPETIVKSERGGELADFELKVDFHITSGGNSGINYRSLLVPDKVTPTNRFAMRGYQRDIDGHGGTPAITTSRKTACFLQSACRSRECSHTKADYSGELSVIRRKWQS
jgi:hypothetical protein